MPPLVSILIPVYNCEAWVSAAIRSALAQTWPNKEVIVFDDGSTDGTLDIVRSFGTQIQFESRRLGGQNVSRNRLIELSRGDWLVFLDADDELMPYNVEAKLTCAREADVLYGSIEMARFSGRDKTNSYVARAVEQTDLWSAAFGWSLPNTSAMMFRRTALLDVGGWPTDFENCTDYALYFTLLLKNYRFRAVPEALSLYRHWSSSQASYENMSRKNIAKIDLLCSTGRELCKRAGFTPRSLRIWSDRILQCVRILYRGHPSKAHEGLKCICEVNPGYCPAPPEFSRLYSLAFRLCGFYVAQRLADKSRNVRQALGMSGSQEPHPVTLVEKST